MAYDVILNIAAEVAKKRAESGVYVNPDDTVCVIRTNIGNIYTGINRIQVNNGTVNLIHAEIDAINNMKLNNENIIESITVINSYTLNLILPCNSCINIIISIHPENIKCQIITPTHNIPITAVNQFIANNNASGSTFPVNNNANPSSPVRNTPLHSGSFTPGYQPYTKPAENTQGNIGSMTVNTNNSITSMQAYPPMTSNQLNSSRMNSSNYLNQSQTSSTYSPYKTKSSKGDQLRNKINSLLNDDDDYEIEDDDSNKKTKKKFGGLFG